ncbi:hypothetical protein PABY_19390 [Pyrodictium abyssi]|uniref:Glycosyltransferase 2-like domain-containing protein n=1 Tax=Pyrodictium abyssi TaxID=54256 RepID=A0ABM8IZV1_9CREN|nr:hypothetical protein PABY_19390 [Pyrodictium abyssi]
MLRNTMSSISATLGIIDATKEGKQEGITAMVCTFNEEEWIELSLLSIKEIVDEYIVIDSSFDNTPHIIERLKMSMDSL